MDVKVRITNWEFVQDMNNSSSKEYDNFVRKFKHQMRPVYETISGFTDVEVLSLKKGSIVVHHIITAEVNFESNAEEYRSILNNVEKVLEHSQENCTTSNESLCFDNSTLVSRIELNESEVCKLAVPSEFRKYYEAVNSSQGTLCISKCNTLRQDHYQCSTNNARCILKKDGPVCYCSYSDTFWYTGTFCEVAIHKVGVYVGIAIAVAVIIALIAALFVFVHHQRHIKKTNQRDREKKDELISSLYDKDWEWNAAEGFSVNNLDSVSWGGTGSSKSDHGEKGQRPSNPSFTLQLENVDTVQNKIPRPQLKPV